MLVLLLVLGLATADTSDTDSMSDSDSSSTRDMDMDLDNNDPNLVNPQVWKFTKRLSLRALDNLVGLIMIMIVLDGI